MRDYSMITHRLGTPIKQLVHSDGIRAIACYPEDPWFRKIIEGSYLALYCQLIGLREKLQENPIFHGKIYGFL